MGKLVRAAQGYGSGKDRSKYLDTLLNITIGITPEDVWRDVLVIAYDHAADSATVVDSVGYTLNTIIETVFPDSSFAVDITRKADYTPTQRSTLQTIAAACPLEYGSGVYVARAMLSAQDTVVYTALNDCEKAPVTPSGKRGQDDEQEEGLGDDEGRMFNLFPNPNGGEFTVDLSLGDTEEAQLSVWSISGQLVHQSNLVAGRQEISLSASQGLYLYMVQVNGNHRWKGKVSILPD